METKEQAASVVKAIKYPPIGTRDAAFSLRAANYGTVPIQQYLDHANEQSLIGNHIESGIAVQNLEGILSVEGIDMVFIGPTDLSVSMGHGGSIEHPEVLKSIDKINHAAKESGVKVGIHTKNTEGARYRQQWGADYISLTVTSLLNDSFIAYIQGDKR